MKKRCESGREKRSIELPVLGSVNSGQIRESRAGRWRAVVLITLTALMVAHVIQWRITGSTVSPIEPSETMFTLQNGAVNAGFIFFSLAIITTLVFGRWVCGWGCHIVALQDLCGWLLKKMGLKPRPFRSRLLVFVPVIVALYMFVWPTALRMIARSPDVSVIPQFTNHIITTEFWATFPTVAVAIPFLFVCGFMTVYFLGSKGFCTYACPYGGVFGLVDKVAPGRIRVTDACNECGHCTAVCTSNVIVHAEVKQHGMVVDPGCMKCMDCVSVCPNDALYFGFGKPPLIADLGMRNADSKVSRQYSLSWGEEIVAALVFAASFLAVWDAFQLVPMLMALGVAAVTTYLVMRTVKLFRSADLSFYRFNLKNSGKLRRAGWAFAGFAALWTAMVTHAGYIHYNESAGSLAFEKVHIPDELALAQANPSAWLTAADNANIAAGKKYLYNAFDGSLLVNTPNLAKLAWLEFLSGDAEQSLRLLGLAAARQDGQARALSLYYRGAILNRLGRYDEAMTELDAAIATRGDLAAAREEKGESLWMLKRQGEAVAAWSEAINSNPNLPLALNFLAGAGATPDDGDTGLYERQADAVTPADGEFNWMLGLRLQKLGMNRLAEKHFQTAVEIEPKFILRRKK